MDFCFRKYSYPFVVVLLVFLFSCHSLPPSEPLAEEKEFDPRELSWQQVSMPTDLLGDWYMEGKLDLTVTEDTLYVHRFRTLIQSVAKADIYYRIIYNVETQYNAVYFRNLTEDKIQIAYTDSNSVDVEGAAGLPVAGIWYTLISTNPWIPTSMPTDMPGNWHIRDGEMELVIDRERVVLDGTGWEIDSVETNRTEYRLILRSGTAFKSLYYREVGPYTMEALLTEGKADIQDRYGTVPGDWSTLYRWWDFIEALKLHQGSSWTYAYDYWKNINIVENGDSITMVDSITGQIELVVVSNTIQGGNGSLILQTTCSIEEQNGLNYHARNNGELKVLADSSWSLEDTVITIRHEISLENDSLWYDTADGKLIFASMRFKPGARVFVRAFIYPFNISSTFWNHRDLYAGVLLPGVDLDFVKVGSDRMAKLDQVKGLKEIICSDLRLFTPFRGFAYHCTLLIFTEGS